MMRGVVLALWESEDLSPILTRDCPRAMRFEKRKGRRVHVRALAHVCR